MDSGLRMSIVLHGSEWGEEGEYMAVIGSKGLSELGDIFVVESVFVDLGLIWLDGVAPGLFEDLAFVHGWFMIVLYTPFE